MTDFFTEHIYLLHASLCVTAIMFLMYSRPTPRISSFKKRRVHYKLEIYSPIWLNSPEQFKITLSSTGGFTELTKGYTLYSSGKIEHWQHPLAQDNLLIWAKQVTPDKIKGFKQKLETSEKSHPASDKIDAITTMVIYESPDIKYVWSWNGSESSGQIPEVLKEWYQSIQGFCHQLNGHSQHMVINGDKI